MSPEVPSSIDALLATASTLGKRAMICVSRRKNEVEAGLGQNMWILLKGKKWFDLQWF